MVGAAGHVMSTSPKGFLPIHHHYKRNVFKTTDLNVGLRMFNNFLTFIEAIHTEAPCIHQRKKQTPYLVITRKDLGSGNYDQRSLLVLRISLAPAKREQAGGY